MGDSGSEAFAFMPRARARCKRYTCRRTVEPVELDDLGNDAAVGLRVAERVAARPIDHRVALTHHGHEALGAAEHALDVRVREREGCGPVVGAKGFDLPLDRAADCLAFALRLGECGKSQPQTDQNAQKAFAHRMNPRLEKTGSSP